MLLQQRLLKASLNALKGALPASQEGMILPLSSVGVRRQHAMLYLVVVSTVQERHRYTGRSAMKDHKDKGTGASDIGREGGLGLFNWRREGSGEPYQCMQPPEEGK